MTAPAVARRRQVATGRLTEQALAPTITLYRDYAKGKFGAWWRVLPGEPGAALLVRRHPATVGPQGARRLAGKGVTDYFGVTLTDVGPRPIAFDCKSVQGAASFALKPKEQHQVAFLKQVRAFGGLAFFLLLDVRVGWCWLIHQPSDLALLAAGERVVFCERKRGTPVAHYVTACERARFPGVPVLGYDFLGALMGAG